MDASSPAPRPRRHAAPETGAADAAHGAPNDAAAGHAPDAGAATSVLTRPRPPADDATAAAPVQPRRRRAPGPGGSGARRVGIGILVGAAVMLLVATLDSVLGTPVPVLGSFAAPPGSPSATREQAEPAPAPPPDTAGTCLTWSRDDAADTAAIDCARPHLFEQAGRVQLADQPAFPTDDGWQKLVTERCTPLVTKYLNGRYDPDGRFRVGALKPSQSRWDDGDRGMRCGLQSASRSGAMLPISGKVAQQDQSAVQPAGTCLGIDGRAVGDPTDCSGPHAVETVGVVDLGAKFKDDFPSVEDQDGFLQPACQNVANTYAGNPQTIGSKGLTVYWNNLSEASWKAGSHRVNCNVGTLLPDGSGFAAITGSLKGQVSVAGRPGGAAPSTGQAPDGGGDSGGSGTSGDSGDNGGSGDSGATGQAPAPQTPAAPRPPAPSSQDGDSEAPVPQPAPQQPAAPDAGAGGAPNVPSPLRINPALPGLGN
ncbi:septum formation family protein [Pseudonocardia phyllosphaerae]|uniref:septum formation family protein n=1 Tax=Pseudonocardia phyllosphaerae TaxID=3390502 RepID=UPI00397E31EE